MASSNDDSPGATNSEQLTSLLPPSLPNENPPRSHTDTQNLDQPMIVDPPNHPLIAYPHPNSSLDQSLDQPMIIDPPNQPLIFDPQPNPNSDRNSYQPMIIDPPSQLSVADPHPNPSLDQNNQNPDSLNQPTTTINPQYSSPIIQTQNLAQSTSSTLEQTVQTREQRMIEEIEEDILLLHDEESIPNSPEDKKKKIKKTGTNGTLTKIDEEEEKEDKATSMVKPRFRPRKRENDNITVPIETPPNEEWPLGSWDSDEPTETYRPPVGNFNQERLETKKEKKIRRNLIYRRHITREDFDDYNPETDPKKNKFPEIPVPPERIASLAELNRSQTLTLNNKPQPLKQSQLAQAKSITQTPIQSRSIQIKTPTKPLDQNKDQSYSTAVKTPSLPHTQSLPAQNQLSAQSLSTQIQPPSQSHLTQINYKQTLTHNRLDQNPPLNQIQLPILPLLSFDQNPNLDPKLKLTGTKYQNLNPIPVNPLVDPPPGACFNCWKRGHLAKNCPEPQNFYCINCGMYDYLVTTCPRCKDAYKKAKIAENPKERSDPVPLMSIRIPNSQISTQLDRKVPPEEIPPNDNLIQIQPLLDLSLSKSSLNNPPQTPPKSLLSVNPLRIQSKSLSNPNFPRTQPPSLPNPNSSQNQPRPLSNPKLSQNQPQPVINLNSPQNQPPTQSPETIERREERMLEILRRIENFSNETQEAILKEMFGKKP